MTERSNGCPVRGAQLAATLARPAGSWRGAVVLLHPADDPSWRQSLFEHLAIVLPGHGIAVLRYDRRARACPVDHGTDGGARS